MHKTMEDLFETRAAIANTASRSCDDPSCLILSQCSWVSEETRREKLGRTASESSSEALKIDLDEDGPLREEYTVCLRDASAGNDPFCDGNGNTILGSLFGLGQGFRSRAHVWPRCQGVYRHQPKWSPAPSHYMAVQPPLATLYGCPQTLTGMQGVGWRCSAISQVVA
jgi:hypothetical protein